MTWHDILHAFHHISLAFLAGLLAWLLTWIIWRLAYSWGVFPRPATGRVASVARSISGLFWALLFFLAIGSHILIDY
jgi:hypothetical protein